jgi:AraC-like DNA-binding protein
MVSGIFGALLDETAEDHPLKKEIVQSYFKVLLLSVMKEVKNNQHIIDKTDIRLIDQFQTLLEKNFRIKKLVADYARELLVGPGYLNEMVKKITGLSASWHIRQRIVLEAKRYGAYTDMCMKEIAYDLGFLDVSHFSKYFKTVSGINFSTFIEQTHMPVFGTHASLCF